MSDTRLGQYESGRREVPFDRGGVGTDPRFPGLPLPTGPRATTVPLHGEQSPILGTAKAIVQGGDKIRSGVVHIESKPTLIRGIDRTRRRLVLRVLTPDPFVPGRTLFLGEANVSNQGQHQGFPVFGPFTPLSAGEPFVTHTQAELYAIAPDGEVTAVSWWEEFAIGE